MTFEIGLALAIIVLALLLFISEWLTIDTVAILVMVAFMATGILTPEEGFKGFTNPATLTVGAMFIISYAVFHSGALSQVGFLLKRASGASYFLLLLAVMATTSTLCNKFLSIFEGLFFPHSSLCARLRSLGYEAPQRLD